jgi:hypothetical protein
MKMAAGLDSFLKLYEFSPTLVLFQGPVSMNCSKEKEIISRIFGFAEKERLNPIDVVLESLVNVVCEDISREELTHSNDTVLINSRIRDSAAQRIVELVSDDVSVLKTLHKSWLSLLKNFIQQVLSSRKDIRIEEIIFLVGSRFRISSSSAIRAIASVK